MTIANITKLGRYEIISPIGAGGMGEVYLAEDARLHRKVALKVLPENIAADKHRLRRFEQEAFAASALNHPNILTIYEFGAENEIHFLAAEFVEGETLRERLQREPFSIDEALDVAAQTVSALAAAHTSGIIHRDVKPENIMIRRDRLVKVLDFGLAKLLEKKTETSDAEAETRAQVNTAPGMIMGTAGYMSPEQARGKETDARSDIWNFGVVLYEMLTRRQPFAGETVNDTIAAVLTKQPAPPTNFNRGIPAELERIVLKTLAKDVEERYQTAKDLLVDLKHLKKQIELGEEIERTASANNRLAEQSENATQIIAAQTTSGAQYGVGKIKNNKPGFVILSVLVLAVIGFGYWFFLSRSASKINIESIAVLPFVNESGNADVEYLSDGKTETLISSLSQLPKLSVKARSSVFRYKGKATEAKQVGADLNVQAVLNGRVTQRGDDLTLYLSLDDVQTGNQIWGRQYNRKITNLVALQAEIARDVSNNLRTKLSGADEQKLAKKYTENAEAYQLYLKGRFHLLKTTRAEFQTSISYFQQAIAIDPFYALAYAGLADAYRSLSLAGEMPSAEVMPKAKAAGQKAIEIDDTLAEAHAVLGWIIFWYDWDWSAAENQYKRALELDPNNADTHLFYAHLLSNTGR
ncbi:MAG TPA: protein kinase, partial [Pyrinomonadaceae bacterium]|nr:protein kinase [Pyrinomonadaceae bacterium]